MLQFLLEMYLVELGIFLIRLLPLLLYQFLGRSLRGSRLSVRNVSFLGGPWVVLPTLM